MEWRPLNAGQAFSFERRLFVVTCGHPKVFMPVGEREYRRAPEGRRHVIQPGMRLIAQDDLHVVVGGYWSVLAGLPGMGGCRVMFVQCLTAEGVALLPGRPVCRGLDWGVPVADVGWPLPTPGSLMVQTRVLSYWQDGNALRGVRTHREISWRRCQQLATMPVYRGLPLAITGLTGIVGDPAQALRQRGFAV